MDPHFFDPDQTIIRSESSQQLWNVFHSFVFSSSEDGNPKIVKAIIAQVPLIDSQEVAFEVAKVVEKAYCTGRSAEWSGCHEGLYNVVIACFKHATGDADTLEKVFQCIADILEYHPTLQSVFCTQELANLMINALGHHVASNATLELFCRAMRRFVDPVSTENQALFCNNSDFPTAVIGTLSHPRFGITECASLCYILGYLFKGNKDSQKAFTSTSFVSTLADTMNRCTKESEACDLLLCLHYFIDAPKNEKGIELCLANVTVMKNLYSDERRFHKLSATATRCWFHREACTDLLKNKDDSLSPAEKMIQDILRCETSEQLNKVFDVDKFYFYEHEQAFIDAVLSKADLIDDTSRYCVLDGLECFTKLCETSWHTDNGNPLCKSDSSFFEVFMGKCFLPVHFSVHNIICCCNIISNLVQNERSSAQACFTNSRVAASLLNAVKNSHSGAVMAALLALIYKTEQHDLCVSLFATPEFSAALIDQIHKDESPRGNAADMVGSVIGALTFPHVSGTKQQESFASDSALLAAITYALEKWGDQCFYIRHFGIAIENMCNASQEAKSYFSSQQAASLLMGLLAQPNTRDGEAIEFFCGAIFAIINANDDALPIFKEHLEQFKTVAPRISTPGAEEQYNLCLKVLTGGGASFVPPAPSRRGDGVVSDDGNTIGRQRQDDSTNNNAAADRISNLPTTVAALANSDEAEEVTNDLSQAPPPQRCFVRGVPKDLSLEESVAALLSIRELPHQILSDGSKKILRPDLKDYIPMDDDVKSLMSFVERQLPIIKNRPVVEDLIKSQNLDDDDIRALLLYKIEDPYPLYLWLNAWLMGQRDERIKRCVGPIFTRIYRAMEKLPKVECRGSRSVKVRNIPALRRTFDNYEERCAPGQLMTFWGFSSFSTNDGVGACQFAGGAQQEAITYSCPDLEGVNMEPFKPEGMSSEDEILPLCPAVFEIAGAVKSMSTKLIVMLKQLDHKEFCYVVPSE